MSLEVTSGGKEKRINFLLQSIMWMFIFPLKGRFEKTKAGRREGEGRMEGGREREGEGGREGREGEGREREGKRERGRG